MELRGSEFAALIPAMSPSPGVISSGMNLLAVPGAAQAPAIWKESALGIGAPSLFGLLWYQSSGTDVSVGAVPYGNPFPATWGSVVVAYQLVTSVYPKGSQNYGAGGTVAVWMPLEEATSGPIQPKVSPVQNVRIAGQDGFGAPTGTGLAPTLTWDPPATGSPTAYRVGIWTAPPCSRSTSPWGCPPDFTIVTTETSVVMPPGILTEGGQYQVVVTAEVSPIDVTTQPFRHGPTLATADAVSGLATP